MSLENEIIKLTQAIEKLTSVIIADVKQDIPAIINAEPTTIAETSEPATSQPTHEDVKALCLELSRTVEGGKEKAKSILVEHGAKKANELTTENVLKVATILKGLLNA